MEANKYEMFLAIFFLTEYFTGTENHDPIAPPLDPLLCTVTQMHFTELWKEVVTKTTRNITWLYWIDPHTKQCNTVRLM